MVLSHRHLPRWAYSLMLILAAAIWGLSTVVIKDTVGSFPPGWLVGIRFLAAGIILSLVLLPRMIKNLNFDHLKTGGLLGIFLGLAYLLNSTGLTYTTASKSAFLTATYCVLVPFFAWALLHKRPTTYNVSAALVCILGVGCVSLQASGVSLPGVGDSITLASAVFLGLHLALTSRLAPRRDILVLTAVQFVVAGLIGLAWGLVAEPCPTPEMFSPDFLFNLAYIVLAASCIALLLQNIGLAHVPPAPAALFLSTESVFGVIFSVIFLGEIITAQMLFGFVLIFIAIVVSEYLPTSKFIARMTSRRKRTPKN